MSEQEFAKASQREVERLERERKAAAPRELVEKFRARREKAPFEKTMILRRLTG